MRFAVKEVLRNRLPAEQDTLFELNEQQKLFKLIVWFDDQSQERILLEAEAIIVILARIEQGLLTWTSSEAVDYEIARNPNLDRARKARLSRSKFHNNGTAGAVISETRP
ncbi:MAG: hypothetical protein ABI977_37250 [Acidobacteriota bacterium]